MLRLIDQYKSMPQIIELGKLVASLYARWQSQKELEDWRDYRQHAEREVQKIGARFVCFSKRPFDLEFIWHGNNIGLNCNKKGVTLRVRRIPHPYINEPDLIHDYASLPQIKELSGLISSLYSRWEFEKEYEEWREYMQVAHRELEKIGAHFIYFIQQPLQLAFEWHGNNLRLRCDEEGVTLKVKRVPDHFVRKWEKEARDTGRIAA